MSSQPQNNSPKSAGEELREFVEKEELRNKKNKLKNKSVIITSVAMVLIFTCMIVYLCRFMIKDSYALAVDSSNVRSASLTENVVRGSILSDDGTVLAETLSGTRNYPYEGTFAHAVGYASNGGSGIELMCEELLLNTHINPLKKVYNELKGEKNPGDSVVTTLNIPLQRAIEEAMSGASGAAVVIEPSTGKILAMYSNPGFNPNTIDAEWESLVSDTSSSVLLNRATQGLYAPGSTFKVVAALEYMKEYPDEYDSYTFTCGGTDIYNSVSIRCSNGKAHGELNLTKSLAVSCNNSFANIGVNYLSMVGLRSMCDTLLFNSELPYDGEYSESSFVLDGSTDVNQIPQTIIGQGDTLITPLHNAMIMCAIANGGILMKPTFVSEVVSSEGITIKEYSATEYGEIISPELCTQIIPMLTEVVQSGTASSQLSGQSYTAAGKTGTAETDNSGSTNSWFSGFSNVEDPDIVVSVIVEDYSSNGISGAYVARCIFDAYYSSIE